LLIIIPTYNEIENIEAIIRAVFSRDERFHILIVDDNSPDGTAAKVKALQSQDIGIILSTHNPDHVFLCDSKVAVVKDHTIAALGSPDEVMIRERIDSTEEKKYEEELKIKTVFIKEIHQREKKTKNRIPSLVLFKSKIISEGQEGFNKSISNTPVMLKTNGDRLKDLNSAALSSLA